MNTPCNVKSNAWPLPAQQRVEPPRDALAAFAEVISAIQEPGQGVGSSELLGSPMIALLSVRLVVPE